MRITSWADLELKHLFYAYRKAKADCFFERSIRVAERFAEYESHLPERLGELATQLRAGHISEVLLANLGQPQLIPKKLALDAKTKKGASSTHGFFSDPDRALDHLFGSHRPIPEFRLVGDFPVDMHVLSGLWINHVGDKYDATLSRSAFGSRLRRYRAASNQPKNTLGDYHIEAIGSFQPYFEPYKRWRGGGLDAIRHELEAERPVVAMSMDLTSYYHQIDPSFIANRAYLATAGITLSPWELDFTVAFAEALKSWAELVTRNLQALECDDKKTDVGGLPIGLSMARVVANALLVELDRDIEQGLSPVYYGRYVDDLFIVLRDPKNLNSAADLLAFISKRTKSFPPKTRKGGEILLALPQAKGAYQGKTVLKLQQSKQKAFFLEGPGGLDLLDNIKNQISSVSSERRLMPSPDRLDSMASARVLTAAGHPSEEADTLRKADGLAVRRLGWSIQLRAVETLAKVLRKQDWREERNKFYEFAHSHVLRPDRILDHLDYLPRLLSLAVALADWPDAHRLLKGALRAIRELQLRTRSGPIKVNGLVASGDQTIWSRIEEAVLQMSREAIICSLPWSQRLTAMKHLSEAALALCTDVGLPSTPREIEGLALRMRESDLAKTPYKDHLRRNASRQRPIVAGEEALHGAYKHEGDLREFLRLTSDTEQPSGAARVTTRAAESGRDDAPPSLLPYICPTRAYTTQEISLFLPEQCLFGADGHSSAKNWASYVRAVRGVWVWAALVDDEERNTPLPQERANPERPKAYLGTSKTKGDVRLGISSLRTTEDTWRACAAGLSDLSRERYGRIERLVNQAIAAYPKPTHLLLPELSLPERWLEAVALTLSGSDISLVAGLDYHHYGVNSISSEAVLVLADDRLGYPAFVQIRQRKSHPAVREEESLLRSFGKEWRAPPVGNKPVYVHNGFSFGVLVCSELQNVQHRLRFQGDVDCVMVLSWNQDLDTFAALVESASLDVHAYIALVNNLLFGDSRVRAPAKKHHDRDLCRLRGGQNEHVVVVELDTQSLREFQSRAKRWPGADDPFKPVPEGFQLADFRKALPS